MADKQELMTKGAYHAIRHRFHLSNGDMDAICGAVVLIPSIPLPEPESVHPTVSIRPPRNGAEWVPGADGLYIAKVMVQDGEPICAQAVNLDECEGPHEKLRKAVAVFMRELTTVAQMDMFAAFHALPKPGGVAKGRRPMSDVDLGRWAVAETFTRLGGGGDIAAGFGADIRKKVEERR